MCDVLQLPRSTYYYESKIKKADESELTSLIVQIFNENRQCYGTRKIKQKLQTKGWVASRRRIGRIMKEQGLVSKYAVAQYKPSKTTCNEANLANKLGRNFEQEQELTTVVSDLSYVRVSSKWHYICVILDLFNREIIGYSSGPKKDAKLVYKAFSSIQEDLNKIELFHTDRGNEFKNQLIDDTLETFNIKHSLSPKGSPYDNAVAEATFKLIKTEFVKGAHFETQSELELELFDYVHWFNNFRIHSTLGYLSPIEYKSSTLKKLSN